MKYRVRCDLIFNKTDNAKDIIKLFESHNTIGKVMNLAREKSFIELEECHHDESPPQPCKVISRIEKE